MKSRCDDWEFFCLELFQRSRYHVMLAEGLQRSTHATSIISRHTAPGTVIQVHKCVVRDSNELEKLCTEPMILYSASALWDALNQNLKQGQRGIF